MGVYTTTCDECQKASPVGTRACSACGADLRPQRERTLAVLQELVRSPAGTSARAAEEALRALAVVPGFGPAPKAAASESGLITLFWDSPSYYADMEFPGDGTFSVFTRHRVGEHREDAVQEREPLDNAPGAVSRILEQMFRGALQGSPPA
jgi:hypothetical protein